MSIGDCNPLPFVIGDEPSPVEQAYSALKSMVGTNGSAADGTIEADWRWAKAQAMGALATFDDRASLQAFPQVAYDFVEPNERMLGMNTDALMPRIERAARVAEVYALRPSPVPPSLLESIRRVEPTATILWRGFDAATVTTFGRYYRPLAGSGGDPWDYLNGCDHSGFAAYSDEFETTVLVPIETGSVPTTEMLRRISVIEQLLADALPAFVGYQVICESDSFTLDASLLDLACPGTEED